MTDAPKLIDVYRGWVGHQESLVEAIRGLSPDQLSFRPRPELRSLGEIAGHIAEGRFSWFQRILQDDAPDILLALEVMEA